MLLSASLLGREIEDRDDVGVRRSEGALVGEGVRDESALDVVGSCFERSGRNCGLDGAAFP